ncbi:short coiled-coil protein isoform X1 [Ixodes scapularis]|uniref:short coiled-coil protein isoform X1 n=1 Tax=Ixodes scapularis TaxID=6945 RepID=UPI001AD6927E|nr:short coiled-coil protein isoform X1 [Ixodes scapularis]XP_040357409.1 short coiled-coil protein isoform X1 [Ixodes scapularis]
MSVANRASKFQEEMNNIPLADEDAQDESEFDTSASSALATHSVESIPSTYTNGSNSPALTCEYDSSAKLLDGRHYVSSTALDPDMSPDEVEEKARLISQVLELQNTLDDLSQRVDSVKEENLKLKSENQVLGQYIENLMSASSVFQSTSPKTKKKGSTRGKK